MKQKDAPKERFSDRAAFYVRYRPSYPTAVYTHLQTHCNLTSGSVIADIGSGTGLLAQLFLQRGNTVFGIEPNQAMREAGEAFLVEYDTFHSINGSAEATTLADNSVDFVIAGQAAHWFDPLPTKAEFERILRPNGHIAFVWNKRAVEASPFMTAYQKATQQFARADSHAKATGTPDFKLFASRRREREQVFHIIKTGDLEPYPHETFAFMNGLQGYWFAEQGENEMVDIELTPERLIEMGENWRNVWLNTLPPEEVLARYTPEDRMAGLQLEDRLAGLQLEERLGTRLI